MTFNWEDYLKLSEMLFDEPNKYDLEEATLRTITSRAYYAAFKCLYNFAEKEGYYWDKNGSIHLDLQNYFERGPGEVRKKISKDLGRLYNNRIEVDYHNDIRYTTPNNLANQSITTANQILDKLATLAKDE